MLPPWSATANGLELDFGKNLVLVQKWNFSKNNQKQMFLLFLERQEHVENLIVFGNPYRIGKRIMVKTTTANIK